MKIRFVFFALCSVLLLLTLGSCRDRAFDMFNNTKGSYFSINKYIIDEWQTHAGEPITFLKSVKMNGKLDTSYTNVLQMDWKPVLSVFSATDISDRKFLGKYTFSQFEDNFDNTLNYMYVADREDLFTQKLLITIDNRSRKVKGIYIETLKSNFFGETRQKLFYSPARTIQIQQYDKPLIGAKKDLVVSYESVEQ